MRKFTTAGWLIMSSIFVFISSSSICDVLPDVVIRTYKMPDGLYDYTLADMVQYSGQLIAELFLFWVARLKVRNEKLPRCACQWAIDLVVTDLVYVLFSNPATWNSSKLIMMGIATVAFGVFYWLDYIKLWHFYWVDSIKYYYHEKNKHK